MASFLKASFLFIATAQALVISNTHLVQVNHQWNRVTLQNGTAAFTESGELLGYSNDNSLDTGNFKEDPVRFHVNDWTGSGTITVAGKTYNIHAQPDEPNAPICYQFWHPDETTIKCQVLMPANWQPSIIPAPQGVGYGFVDIHYPTVMQPAVTQVTENTTSSPDAGAVDKRQYCFNEYTSVPDHNVACTDAYWGHYQTTVCDFLDLLLWLICTTLSLTCSLSNCQSGCNSLW